MLTIVELKRLHGTAVEDAGRLVEELPQGRLDGETPCAGWSVRDLIGHLIGQNLGFARAVAEGDADASAYAPPELSDGQLVAAWRRSADRLTAAFARADEHRSVRLVEIAPGTRLPLERVIGIQLLDTVIHSWDLAESLGAAYRPADDLVAAVAAAAAQVPGGDQRARPGAAFAPALPGEDDDPWLGALAQLGRAPARLVRDVS